ncbi:MAG: hypothetical protein IPG93_14820 [Burkholderiales bacterium]|nr:hypothetical protein [Burkholderiales bacterium]
MQKLIFGFVAFAAVLIFAISRGGDVDISGEARGISYSDSAASAPEAASASASAPMPGSAAEASATLARQ